MKLVVLYRPDSEYARAVEMFVHDFKRQHEGVGRRLEVIDYDTREGQAEASIYDVMSQPALLVQADDGQLVKNWEGGNLPMLDEVASYFYTSGSTI
jgi:long-subunit acyl-CoA synthetase (AMP-forming)